MPSSDATLKYVPIEEISWNKQISSKSSKLDSFLSRRFPCICIFPRSAFCQANDASLISRIFQLYGKYPRKWSVAENLCSRKNASWLKFPRTTKSMSRKTASREKYPRQKMAFRGQMQNTGNILNAVSCRGWSSLKVVPVICDKNRANSED